MISDLGLAAAGTVTAVFILTLTLIVVALAGAAVHLQLSPQSKTVDSHPRETPAVLKRDLQRRFLKRVRGLGLLKP